MEARDFAELTLIQQGDSHAMAGFYERYSRIVYSVALRVLKNSASAEDILQEVFMQIWRGPGSCLEAKGEIRGWLAVVSRNRAIDLLRKRRPSDSIENVYLPSPYKVSTDAEHNLLCEKARIAIEMLPINQQQALNMAYFGGMTQAEISEATGCPLGTIKTRIRSGMAGLRKALTETKVIY
jgi:RNA polymerase sigma-70 factor, ECF subfamily